jgi:hypothetical protein
MDQWEKLTVNVALGVKGDLFALAVKEGYRYIGPLVRDVLDAYMVIQQTSMDFEQALAFVRDADRNEWKNER